MITQRDHLLIQLPIEYVVRKLQTPNTKHQRISKFQTSNEWVNSRLVRLVFGASDLNEQVKRNRERFPDRFFLHLTPAEKTEVVANCDHLEKPHVHKR